MKKLVPCTAFAVVLFSQAYALAAPAVAAPPAATPTVNRVPTPKMKMITKMTTQQTLAVPGEKRVVKATLVSTANNAPVANANVSFTWKGKSKGKDVTIAIGSDKTDANGLANFEWHVPELDQAPGTLTATYAGDEEHVGSKDDANFGIIKGITKIDIGHFTYGPIDSTGGSSYPVCIISVNRASDGQALAKPVWLTVNGQNRRQINNGTNPSIIMQILLEPYTGHDWDVKVEFEGDEANQSAMSTAHFHH